MTRREGRNRPRRKRIRARNYIPNTITILNMFMGFLSVLFSLQGQYELAAWFIFMGAFSDGLDGKVARAMGTTSDFGIQFDSLADLITFCMAPSVLVYRVWAEPLGTGIGGFFAFMPLMMGAIRLARFNLEAKDNQRHRFLGVPSPLMAITVSGLYLWFHRSAELGWTWVSRTPDGDSRVVLPLVMILSALMLSKVPFPKAPALTLRGGPRNTWMLLMFFTGLVALLWTRGLILFPLAFISILAGLIRWTQMQRIHEELPQEELP